MTHKGCNDTMYTPCTFFCLKVLHANLSELGGLRTAPYLAMFASSNFGGWLGDNLIVGQQYAVVSARRVVNSIGSFPDQLSAARPV